MNGQRGACYLPSVPELLRMVNLFGGCSSAIPCPRASSEDTRALVLVESAAVHQSHHNVRNRSGASCVYRTVCLMLRWPRYAWIVRVSTTLLASRSRWRVDARRRVTPLNTRNSYAAASTRWTTLTPTPSVRAVFCFPIP